MGYKGEIRQKGPQYSLLLTNIQPFDQQLEDNESKAVDDKEAKLQ